LHNNGGIVLYCPKCGVNNKTSLKSCSQCGYSFSDGTASDASSPRRKELSPGIILDKRYKILNIIERGGMGAVYKAFDLRLDIVCAVKEMRENFERDEYRLYAIERFKDEALILSKLRHSNIPRVSDYFIENNRYYITMDFIEGETLFKKCIKRPGKRMEEEELVGWVLQLCDVFSYLHHQNPPIIYRDVKPANIMINNENQVMLIDFGIARIFNPQSKGTMIGTQGYSPPEQYRGKVEPRSDIYALGATLHHLITGKDPQKDAPFSFLPVKQLRPDVSNKFAHLVDKCLKFSINERFSSTEEIRTYLLSPDRAHSTMDLEEDIRLGPATKKKPEIKLVDDELLPEEIEDKKESPKTSGSKRGGLNLTFELEKLLQSIEKESIESGIFDTSKQEPDVSKEKKEKKPSSLLDLLEGIPKKNEPVKETGDNPLEKESASDELSWENTEDIICDIEDSEDSEDEVCIPQPEEVKEETTQDVESSQMVYPAEEEPPTLEVSDNEPVKPVKKSKLNIDYSPSSISRTGELFSILREESQESSSDLVDDKSKETEVESKPPKISEPPKPPFIARPTIPFGPIEISIPKIAQNVKKFQSAPTKPLILNTSQELKEPEVKELYKTPKHDELPRPAKYSRRDYDLDYSVDPRKRDHQGEYQEDNLDIEAVAGLSHLNATISKFDFVLSAEESAAIGKATGETQEEKTKQEEPSDKDEVKRVPRLEAPSSNLPSSHWYKFRGNKTNSGVNYKSSPCNGNLKWRFRSNGRISASPSVGIDGTIYFGSNDGFLYALDPTGNEKWRFRTENSIFATPLIIEGAGIFIGSQDYNFYCLDFQGRELWRKKLGNEINSSATFDPEGNIIVCCNDGKVYSLNINGEELWRYNINNYIYSTPAVDKEGKIFFGSWDKCVYAMKNSGRVIWKYETGGYIDSSPAIDGAGDVYFGSQDSYFYVVSYEGKLKWKFKTKDQITSSPIVDSEMGIIFGSKDNFIYNLNFDGSLRWRYRTNYWIRSSASMDSLGNIYVGNDDFSCYCLNSEGKTLWKFKTNGAIESSPCIAIDGTLYFGSNDGWLYALE
jgi:serine/threonine protein kinase/outer membrane protein assembly factor BamB